MKGDCCEERRGGWVATVKYTAECAAGFIGTAVQVVKQFRSYHSLEHAQQRALALAKAEATGKLVCVADPYADPIADGEMSVINRGQRAGVGVVVVCHPDYARFLPEALASIDQQTLPFDAKVLVYDAGFSAFPADVYVPDGWQLVVCNWKNPNPARNMGAQILSEMEWLCFWDADNRMPLDYHRDARETLMRAPGNVAVCYPDVRNVDEHGKLLHRFGMPEWNYQTAQHRTLADTASFWRAQALNEVGGFDRTQEGHDDFCLGLRMFRAGWQGQRLPCVIDRTMHGGNRSDTTDCTAGMFNAWTFAFVTLWSGKAEQFKKTLRWLADAEIPPRSVLYWVDNADGSMTEELMEFYNLHLKDKFRAIHIYQGGSCYAYQQGDAYNVLERHTHVAHLYNRVLPNIREEIVVTLEDDTVPPLDGMKKLLALIRPWGNVAIAAGVYRTRHNPEYICASRQKVKWADVPRYDQLPGEPFEVGMTGGGFALIANWALQKALPMRCHRTHDGRLMGWDGNLGVSLTKAGYRMLAHPGVRCEHLCPEVIRFEQERCSDGKTPDYS